MNSEKSYAVPTGEFYISARKPLVLKAILGTCVGLAMYDDVSNVGGLYHILLPEQPNSEYGFEPLKYAGTGLPVFLEGLVEAGAEKRRLKAALAGGALIGPVSSQDVHLDIGGRTAELVKNILAREGVQIVQSETGGLNPCTLTMDMLTWEQHIRPAGADFAPAETDTEKIEREAVRKAIDGIQPIPQVVLKIMRMINDENYYLPDIAEELKRDQVLSARTIKYCNSAHIAVKNRIESVDHALVYLGQQRFARIIVSVYLQDLFNQNSSGYSMTMGGIYHHAVGTARIAEKLTGIIEGIAPSIAHMAGLLHDIGKVVLDQFVARVLPLLYKDIPNTSDLMETERLLLGTDHTAVGGILADRWSFPESLSDVICHHHYPENAVHSPELTHLVYLADLLMSRFNAGLEIEHLNTDHLERRLGIIGLDSSRFAELVDQIPRQVWQPSN